MRKNRLTGRNWPILGQLGILAAMALFASSLQAADHVVAVDVSGSMNWNRQGDKPPFEGPSRIGIVRPAMRNYVMSLPDDTRLFLVSFNSGIVSEHEFLLSRAGDRKAALAWVDALSPPQDSKTYLFATIRRTLLKAREYLASSGEGWVNVRIITDGENDHPGSTLTLKEVLDGFPELKKGLMLPDLVLLGSLTAEFKDLKGLPINPIHDPDFSAFPPVIEWAPSPAIVGQNITFVDSSKSAFQAHRWFVDDVAVGEGKTIKHTFEKPGKFTVRLEVERQNRSRDKARAVVVVGTSPIKAEFHVPSEVLAGKKAEFVDRSTGEVEARKWTVDGKPVGEQRDLAFTFESEGPHEVVLEIAGKNGQKDSTTRSLNVQPPLPPPAAPVADIRMVGEKFKAGEQVQFMDQSTGLIEGYAWDFAGEATNIEKNPVHAFKTAGDKKVNLVVRGPGGEARTSVTLKVWPAAPTVLLSANRKKGTTPLEVRFTATIDGSSNGIEWDFGDNTTSHDTNPVHSYANAGQYTVRAKVSFADTDGPGSVAGAPLTILSKAPMPLWEKILLGVAGVLAFWIIIVVPMLGRRLGLSALRSPAYVFRPKNGTARPVHALARKRRLLHFLWPRQSILLGSSARCDLRIQGCSPVVGRITRVPFQKSWVLIPASPGGQEIVSVRSSKDMLTGKIKTEKPPLTGSVSLQPHDEFEIGGARYIWES
ncbi:MAG: PKD domain-containing protein [Verrucomicrobiota bacterium]